MSEYFLTYLLTSRLLYFGYSYATYPTGIHSKLKAFDCVIFPIHKICSSQFIWEVLWSCLNLETSAFYLNNPAMQDYYRIFNQDCELVSQLPIICFGIQLNYSNGSVQLHLQF